jgi:hypothetical protein
MHSLMSFENASEKCTPFTLDILLRLPALSCSRETYCLHMPEWMTHNHRYSFNMAPRLKRKPSFLSLSKQGPWADSEDAMAKRQPPKSVETTAGLKKGSMDKLCEASRMK